MRYSVVVFLSLSCNADDPTDDTSSDPDPYEHDAGDTACQDVEGDDRAAFRHDIEAWTSMNGTYFNLLYPFQVCADVPSLATDGQGTLLAAFQAWVNRDVETEWDKVAVRTSTDQGAIWGPVTFAVFTGLPDEGSRPFDPTITHDPDLAQWRMYFSMGMNGPQLDDSVCTQSASSTDGVNFTYEADARFCVDGRPVIDPAVLAYEGGWYYAAPRGAPQDGAYFATSPDGLTFTEQAFIPSDTHHNWTGNFAVSDDGFRFFGAEGPDARLLHRGQWRPRLPCGKKQPTHRLR